MTLPFFVNRTPARCMYSPSGVVAGSKLSSIIGGVGDGGGAEGFLWPGDVTGGRGGDGRRTGDFDAGGRCNIGAAEGVPGRLARTYAIAIATTPASTES